MALGKSPQRRRAAAPSADAPSSPGRQRKSAPAKTVLAKGKAKAGQTRQHRTLTVDIPTAPFLGNFLSPLDYAVAEQVSYSSMMLAADCKDCKTPVAAKLGHVCRTASSSVSEGLLHLQLCLPSMVSTLALP